MLNIEARLHDDRARVLCGDALETLKTLPAESVHCVVTSPPYYGLRDYGVEGQLGLEQTPQNYVTALVAVFREVHRVLRADGTAWLNLGDSYAGSSMTGGVGKATLAGTQQGSRKGSDLRFLGKRETPDLKSKDLIGIPWRVAFALQDDGWYLRSDIIWQKSNTMPESVTSRPTKAHEYVFLLAKSPRYYYDHVAVAEPAVSTHGSGNGYKRAARLSYAGRGNDKPYVPTSTRNRRTVWTIPTKPYKGAHFAVFPEALAEPCILAGTSDAGCCPRCLTPYRRVLERTGHVNRREAAHQPGNTPTKTGSTGWAPTTRATDQWRAGCSCAAGPPIPCTVLDPFAGSGTALAVALKHGRSAIGIELNPAYIPLIDARLAAVTEAVA